MISSISWLFSKSHWRLLLLFGLMTPLVGCDRSLDPKITEKTLKEDLVKQGVGSLKDVSCPSDLKAGQKFECLGIFESGIGFRIPVEQKGENDKLLWEIPSIKGMLNMNQVMQAIQGELKVSEGAIDCGTNSTYRMATLGSTFDCALALSSPGQLDGKLPPPKVSKTVKEPDKIQISIASSGDVTWQRMVVAAADATTKSEKTSKMPELETTDKAKASPKPKPENSKAPAAVVEDVPYDS